MKRATGHRIQVTLKRMSLWTVWITLDKLHTRPSEPRLKLLALCLGSQGFFQCVVFDSALIFLPEFLLWTEKIATNRIFNAPFSSLCLYSFVCMKINLEKFSIKNKRKKENKMGTRSFIIRHRFHWTRFSFQQVHLC